MDQNFKMTINTKNINQTTLFKENEITEYFEFHAKYYSNFKNCYMIRTKKGLLLSSECPRKLKEKLIKKWGK